VDGSSSSSIRKFKEQMCGMFMMGDLDLLIYYLGIEVKQGSEGITLSHSSYAKKLLEKGGMEDCKSGQLPMQSKLKLRKKSSTPVVDAIEAWWKARGNRLILSQT
jgi:hypothetical protein